GRASGAVPVARVLPQGRILVDRGRFSPAPAAAGFVVAVGDNGDPVMPGLQPDARSEVDGKAGISRAGEVQERSIPDQLARHAIVVLVEGDVLRDRGRVRAAAGHVHFGNSPRLAVRNNEVVGALIVIRGLPARVVLRVDIGVAGVAV